MGSRFRFKGSRKSTKSFIMTSRSTSRPATKRSVTIISHLTSETSTICQLRVGNRNWADSSLLIRSQWEAQSRIPAKPVSKIRRLCRNSTCFKPKDTAERIHFRSLTRRRIQVWAGMRSRIPLSTSCLII